MFEELCDVGVAIRVRCVVSLDVWIEWFELEAMWRGVCVLFVESGVEVVVFVFDICWMFKVKVEVDGLLEEVDLNCALWFEMSAWLRSVFVVFCFWERLWCW